MPTLTAKLSFDDVTVASPTWVDVSDRVRSFEITSGRSSELEDVQTATATVVLSDPNGDFVPWNRMSIYSPNVIANRRVWLQADGQDRFYGYVDTWTPEGTTFGDATVTIVASDAFKLLAKAKLPAPVSPAESHAGVLNYDKPWGYWRLGEAASSVSTVSDFYTGFTGEVVASAGPNLTYVNGATLGSPGLVVGEVDTCVSLATGQYAQGFVDDALNLTKLNRVSFEAIVNLATVGATNRHIALYFYNVVGGAIQLFINNGTPPKAVFSLETTTGNVTATGATTIAINTVYHLVGTWDGSTARLYLNGVLDGSSATAAKTLILGTTDATVDIGWDGAGAGFVVGKIDEVAMYESALGQARITDHYNSARVLGYNQEATGTRIANITTDTGLPITTDLDAGVRTVLPVRKFGQPALDELRRTVAAEAGDSMLYMTGGGVLTFLAANHRNSSPYNTSQATFGDAPTVWAETGTLTVT